MISTDDGIKIMDGGSTSFKPFAAESNNHKDDDKDNEIMDIPTPVPFVQVSLQQLKEKLDATPYEMKSSLVYAKQVSADLVNDDHLLGFLYVEKFNIDLALARLLKYWTTRRKLFGDKYTQPLTLHGSMSDRIEDIRKGFLILLPVLDERGRAIIYYDPALSEEQQVVQDEVVQVFWYLIHVASENPSVRKNGFILLCRFDDFRIRHLQPRRGLAMIKSTNTIPVAAQHCHMCNPPTMFPLVAQAIKAMLPLRMRETLTIHKGTDVTGSLAASLIPSSCVPVNIGGKLDTSIEAFIRARLTIEGQDNDTMSDNLSTSTSPIGSISDISMMNISDSTTPSSSSMQNYPIPTHAASSEERKIKYKMHPGRKGDCRMNKAVKARQQDPKMSLIAALLAGGFIFPQLYTPGVKMSQMKDTEGVTVYQRKNQLNRRLREERNRKLKQDTKRIPFSNTS